MELFNSLKSRLETYETPFKHWAINKSKEKEKEKEKGKGKEKERRKTGKAQSHLI